MPKHEIQNSEFRIQNYLLEHLKRLFLIIILLFTFNFLHLTFYIREANAQNTPSCDLCAWCTNNQADKPNDWENCMRCLFPARATELGISPGSKYTGSKPLINLANPYYPSHPESPKNWTVFGCLDTAPGGFVGQVYRIIIAIGSGFAFLAFVFGGFRIMTAGGDPQMVSSGKNIIMGAIFGMLLIVFSVFLLKLIGYDIIKIPGFET